MQDVLESVELVEFISLLIPLHRIGGTGGISQRDHIPGHQDFHSRINAVHERVLEMSYEPDSKAPAIVS